MATKQEQIREVASKLTEQLADDGKIIEGGWRAMLLVVIPPTAPQIQIQEMRKAFFCGAQHLFASIMTILEPGSDEPTEKDLARMTLISDELELFRKELEREHPLERGN